MTLTDAPNDFGGRFRLNCALTTPELPICSLEKAPYSDDGSHDGCTMRTGDFPPNHPYLTPSNFSMGTIDEGDLFSEVKAVMIINLTLCVLFRS